MDKIVTGLFQSQTQIDILKDELKNEGLPIDSMTVIGRRVKLENATSDPNAKSQTYSQILSSDASQNSDYRNVEEVSNELAGMGLSEDVTSTYANRIYEGNIGVALRVNEDQARVASGRFRNAGAKYVKIQ